MSRSSSHSSPGQNSRPPSSVWQPISGPALGDDPDNNLPPPPFDMGSQKTCMVPAVETPVTQVSSKLKQEKYHNRTPNSLSILVPYPQDPFASPSKPNTPGLESLQFSRPAFYRTKKGLIIILLTQIIIALGLGLGLGLTLNNPNRQKAENTESSPDGPTTKEFVTLDSILFPPVTNMPTPDPLISFSAVVPIVTGLSLIG